MVAAFSVAVKSPTLRARDEYGRDNWVLSNAIFSDDYSTPRSGHMQGTGVLWIYGDSHNRRLYESVQGRQLCTRVFRACYHTNVWVYWLGSVNSNEMDLRSVKKNVIN